MDWSKKLYLEKFGKAFVPKKMRPYLREYFLKAGYDQVPYTAFGVLFWISAITTYFIYIPFVFPNLQEMGLLWLVLLTFVLWAFIHASIALALSFFFYFYLSMQVFKRTKNIEEKLPDYLNLVSVNLKGGMSFEKSLWTAIKPEFEVLAKEITIVSKSVMTGNDVKEALTEFSQKYDSPVLRRSMDLLIGEIEGGGKIVDVIDSLVKNLKKTSALKRELQVATQTYVIFIAAIVIFIAPALFAVSYQLLQMITSFTANLSGNLQSGVSAPLSFGSSTVSIDEFRNFTYFGLGIIATFSSMIVSIISRGDIRSGLRYIPVFLLSALAVYFVFSTMLGAMFSSFIG